MNILVAEDDSLSRETLRCILESDKNLSVTLTVDGEEAWTHLCDSRQSFDVVIFDIQMPKLDGLGLIERMRASPTLRTLPAILCTAASDRTTVARASSLSVIHYIIKPYSKDVIFEKLRIVRSDAVRDGLENRKALLRRLNLDGETYRALATALIKETMIWVQAARSATEIGKFSQLAQRAAGLRGGFKLLGLSRMAGRLEEIEHTMGSNSTALQGQQFPLLFAQVAPLFEGLEAEGQRTAAEQN